MFKENIKKDLSKEEITNLLVDFDKDNIFQQNLEEKEIQEEFNSKYEDLYVEIDNDGDLKISSDYFDFENVNKLQQAIIDYKRIIKG